jgi:hypothetical protein
MFFLFAHRLPLKKNGRHKSVPTRLHYCQWDSEGKCYGRGKYPVRIELARLALRAKHIDKVINGNAALFE